MRRDPRATLNRAHRDRRRLTVRMFIYGTSFNDCASFARIVIVSEARRTLRAANAGARVLTVSAASTSATSTEATSIFARLFRCFLGLETSF